MNQPDATNGDLARLIPDYMRCPSSPTPKMATQTGTVCLPSYVGISGGTDINPADTTLYPNQRWGQPSPGRVYVNRAAAMFDVGTAQGVVFTNSGMLPLAERKAFQACRDGLSNTMIVSEQSDWLEDVDVNFSSKYHGDPGWGGVTNTDTAGGGFVSGCRENLRIPQGLYTATTYTPSGPIFNITTVRYKAGPETRAGRDARPRLWGNLRFEQSAPIASPRRRADGLCRLLGAVHRCDNRFACAAAVGDRQRRTESQTTVTHPVRQ